MNDAHFNACLTVIPAQIKAQLAQVDSLTIPSPVYYVVYVSFLF